MSPIAYGMRVLLRVLSISVDSHSRCGRRRRKNSQSSTSCCGGLTISHVFADDRHAAETPIILSTQLPQLTGDVLVLLDYALPADWQKEFSRFSRIIDVVSTEPTELKLSRDRWRAYKAAGVELAAYDRRK